MATVRRRPGRTGIARHAYAARWLAPLWGLVLVLLVRPANATPALLLEGVDELVVGRTLDYAFDPTAAKSFDEIASGGVEWKNSDGRVVNLGFVRGSLWGRIELEDRRTNGDGAVVAVPYAPIDRVTLYEVRDDGVRVYLAGDHVPRSEWPTATPYATFPIKPFSKLTLFVRIDDASLELPLVVRSNRYEERVRLVDTVVRTAYLALALGLWLYNLLLWLGTRLTIYGPYCVYAASVVAFSLAVDGTGYAALWPNFSWLNDRLPVIAAGSSAISLLLLQSSLLDLRTTLPRVDRIQRRAALGMAIIMPVAVAIPWPWPMFYLVGSPVVMAVMSLSTALRLARNGIRSAKLFLLAFSSFLFSVIAAALANTGAIDLGPYWTTLIPAGSSIELILFAYALADRIKQLQADVARNANDAREASERALAEQERANIELQRVDKLKDAFLANTSHELRTPLHGILGLTESVLATEAGLSAKSRDRLGMVVVSGRRLSSLVNDILDFSKLRHQAITLREKAFALHDSVALALTVAAPIADAKGLTIRSEVARDVCVRADENRLQQILTNLLGNAVKFTSNGEVVVRAEVRGGRVHVSIQDTGIGIARSAYSRIFESFEQADGSTSREFGGTGLGLAVTKQLVELHGGTVWVESTVGVGSTFSFDLMHAASLDENAQTRSAQQDRGSVLLRASPLADESVVIDSSLGSSSLEVAVQPGSRGHVLVADDDPVNVEVLRAQLEPAGYAVSTARDGSEAVQVLERLGQVDGVLLDVMMPKMTGVEAAARIRQANPHGTLPILMLTAKSRPEDVVIGMRAGASDYIGKPFHREELLQRVDAHVEALKTARAFRRFVPENFLGLLGVERFDALRAGIGQRHVVTILFADVRGFTTRSEQLGPEGIFRFINSCLERFEPVVRSHGGFVDKFIGDAIMAIFPGDALAAARAAAAMHREVARFNVERTDALPLAIGVGVHRGPVILGTVGGEDRMEVTAIGDAVNVAARLESLTKALGAGALVSEQVIAASQESARRVGAIRVKGRNEPVELFELLDCSASDDERTQKLLTAETFQRGLRAYVQRDMARALEHFGECVVAAPLDRVAMLYLERATRYSASVVPEDFDGCLEGV